MKSNIGVLLNASVPGCLCFCPHRSSGFIIARTSRPLGPSIRHKWFAPLNHTSLNIYWKINHFRSDLFEKEPGSNLGDHLSLFLAAALVNLFLVVHRFGAPRGAGIFHYWHTFFIFTGSPATTHDRELQFLPKHITVCRFDVKAVARRTRDTEVWASEFRADCEEIFTLRIISVTPLGIMSTPYCT